MLRFHQEKIRKREEEKGNYDRNQATRASVDYGTNPQFNTGTFETIKLDNPQNPNLLKRPLAKQPTLEDLPPPPEDKDNIDEKPRGRISRV